MCHSVLSLWAGLRNPTAAEEGRSNSRKASIVSGIELNCGVVSSSETIVLVEYLVLFHAV